MRVQRRGVLVALVTSTGLLLAGCAGGDGPQVLDQQVASPSSTPTVDQPSTVATPAPSDGTSVTTDEPAEAAPPSPTPTVPPLPQRPGRPATPRVAGTVATGLTSPWGLAFLPDGSALVTERDTARLLRVDQGTVDVIGSVPGVFFGGEGGLLGVAVAPTFDDDRLVYLYATTSSGNQVLLAPLRQGRLGRVQVVLDDIPRSPIHNGGRLAFGPDGMLYVTTGDASETSTSQRPGSLGGKILRVTPEGDVPPDNPDPSSPVYSSGHRNVQGIAWDAAGTLWASEFGASTWDELNRIRPGANYGWPSVEGAGGEGSGFVDPAVQWPTDQASPSGIVVAENTVFVASLRGQRLWAVPVGGGRAGKPRAFFTGELGRLRTVAAAPDGSLWLVTNNTDGRGVPRQGDDRILRLGVG